MEEALERIRWKSGNELLEEARKRREVKKMLTQYEEYMERRSELIKKGWDLASATNQAFLDAYHPKKETDQMSYANR